MKNVLQALAGLALLALVAQLWAGPPTDDKQREPFRPPPLPGQPQRDPARPFDLPPPPGGPQPPRFQPGGPGPREEAPEDVIRALTAALKDNDLEVRKLAAATLVQLRHGKKATEVLIGLLNSSDVDTRKFAVEHLAAAGSDSVETLAETLRNKDTDMHTRANAAYALAKIGPPAAEANASLLKVIKDDEPEVRRRVLYALNRIYADRMPGPGGLPSGIPPLYGPGSGGSGVPSDIGPQVPDPGVLAPKKPEKTEK
jgi:hypothetical protein